MKPADPRQLAKISTPKAMWKAIAYFSPYNMATLDPVTRVQAAIALTQAAKRLGIAPHPCWEDVQIDPEYYNQLGKRIESGVFEDQQIANSDSPMTDPEAQRAFSG